MSIGEPSNRKNASNLKRKLSPDDVSHTLSECFASNPTPPKTPDDEQVLELTRLINRYIEAPVTSQMMDKVGKSSGKGISDRKILDQAAAILKQELHCYRDVSRESLSPYDIWARSRAENINVALATLVSPGLIDFGKAAPTRRGRDITAWSVMGARLAEETIKALQVSGDRRGKIGRANGPIVRFVREMLELILGEGETVPALETIHEALKGRLKN